MTSSTGAGVGMCRMVASPWFQTPKVSRTRERDVSLSIVSMFSNSIRIRFFKKHFRTIQIEEQDAALQLLSLSPKFSPISLNGTFLNFFSSFFDDFFCSRSNPTESITTGAPLQVPPPLSLDSSSSNSSKMNGFGTRGSFEPEPRKVQRVVPVTGTLSKKQHGSSAMFRSIQSNMKNKRVRPSPSTSIRKVTRGKKSSSIVDNKIQIDRGDLPYNLPIEYALTYNKNGYIGIYSPQERANLLKRYHEKRKRRSWTKLVRYNCRKKLAEKRLRVHGRFVKAGFVPPPSTTEEKKKDEVNKQDTK